MKAVALLALLGACAATPSRAPAPVAGGPPGAIVVRVSDRYLGGPREDVVVMARGPALVGSHSEITDEDGWAILHLPPGIYRLDFYLPERWHGGSHQEGVPVYSRRDTHVVALIAEPLGH
jgi:hypothetical protein